jgi:F0F1-type ATP synthase delta subunit
MIKRTELAKIINKLIIASKDQKSLAKEIAGYLVSSHQISQAEAILRNIESLRAQNGLIEATVTTAFPIDAQLAKQVKSVLQAQYPAAQQIILDNQVEPAVLSGVAIETIDKQMDQTARGKLLKLTKAVA